MQATDAAQAYTLFKEHKPELVVFDIHMLNNGYETLIPELQQDWSAWAWRPGAVTAARMVRR